jgi:hypothetical protein
MSRLKPSESASAAKAIAVAANGRKGGRPKGARDKLPRSRTHRDERSGADIVEGLQEMRKKAPVVGAELVRLALYAEAEPVRAAACRDVLAYAWGRPRPVEGDGGDGDAAKVTIVNVITGVRGP